MKALASQSTSRTPQVAPRRPLVSRLFLVLALAASSFAGAAEARTRSIPIPTPTSQPIAITMGADGNFWFTESNSSRVARVTPKGVITEFVTPTFSFPFDITPGPDGNIWFSEGSTGQIAFITPAGQITEIKFSNFDAAGGITTGPDGNIWFCDSTGNNIWRYDLTAQTLSKFPVPTAGSSPEDITAGPDGNLWFTERAAGKIGRITTSGVITEVVSGLDSPRSIVMGPDGDLWFNPAFAAQLGRLTVAGELSLYPIPARADNIAPGQDNTLLFTEFGLNKIATITVDGVVTESAELPQSEPTGITAGARRSVWFLGFGNNRVYATTLPR